MSTILILYWKSRRYRGEILEIGDKAEETILDTIASGAVDGKIERIERYESENPDATEDIAIALAKRLCTHEAVRPDLYDFIETHAGREYLRGLRRADLTFAGE